jgi:hypothetical protein
MKNKSFNSLQKYAFTPSYSSQIVHNVLKYLSETSQKKHPASTIIFPECGSGFHEWNVLIALKETDHNIKEMIFMDSHIQDEWIPIWQELATMNNIIITILRSYIELDKWSTNTNHQNDVIIIYINGGLKFGESYCKPECLESAVRFWDWCAKHAKNKNAINFIGCDMINPANCTSWSELSREFSFSKKTPGQGWLRNSISALPTRAGIQCCWGESNFAPITAPGYSKFAMISLSSLFSRLNSLIASTQTATKLP